MISDRKGIYKRPQAPSRPFPDMRLQAIRDDDSNQIQSLRKDDGEPALVGDVANVGNAKDHDEG